MEQNNTNKKTKVFISFAFQKPNKRKKELRNILKHAKYAIDCSEEKDRSEEHPKQILEPLIKKIADASVMLVIYSKSLAQHHGGKGCKVKDHIKKKTKGDELKEGWVYKEIKCALSDKGRKGNKKRLNPINGILVLVPDKLWSFMKQKKGCSICNKNLKGFHNYNHIPEIILKNHCNLKGKTNGYKINVGVGGWDDSYIPIIKWSTFMQDPKKFITKIKKKRTDKHKYKITTF